MKTVLFLLFILFPIILFAKQWYPSVAAYDTINYYCNRLASEGDIIYIPADTSIWLTKLTIRKSLKLIGAGTDSTLIISGNKPSGGYEDYLLVFIPARPDSNQLFRLSNLTIDLARVSSGLKFFSSDTSISTKIRIDHIVLKNAHLPEVTARAIWIQNVYGVIDSNIFDNVCMFSGYGLDAASWEKNDFRYGSSKNIYYEDNTYINLYNMFYHDGTSGGRYCVRYCTFTYVDQVSGLFPWFDMHGGQPSAHYGTLGAEVYGNEITLTYNMGINMFGQRGGQAMVWNNNAITSGGAYMGVREEFADSLYPEPNHYLQHANNSYYWNNTKNRRTQILAEEFEDCCNAIAENSEFWNYNADFDGTAGIGVGFYTNMPATCTKDVGYWATDKGGNWNLKNETENDGAFYKAIDTNVWALYYIPYTYPHPLRTSGPPLPPRNLRIIK